MTAYESEGFKNRREYLESLAESFGYDFSDVCNLANLLGPSEDFDGLVTSLDDARYLMEVDA